MTFEAVLYTILTIFAVYGMYTALHGFVSFIVGIFGKDERGTACCDCPHCKISNINDAPGTEAGKDHKDQSE